MGTAAWGGSGEGKCFPCHGLSWWRLLLYFPSQPHRTAVRPKLSAVSVIRLFVRTRQPSATLASPLVCMRETTSLALPSVLHKETSRWSAATTPQEPRVSIDDLHLSQKLMKNQVTWCFFHLISDESSQSHTHRQSQCLCPCLSCPVQVFGGSEISDKIPRVGLFKLQYSLVAMYPPIFNKKIVCPICFQVFFPTSIIVVTTSLISQQIYSSHPFPFFFLKKLCST